MVYRHLTVIENGDIYLCRKLPIKVGNILEDDLVRMYERNDIINKVFRGELIKECNACKLKKVCR